MLLSLEKVFSFQSECPQDIIHLTQEHVEILFGEGYHLTKFKELMGGQFAIENEKVTIRWS